MKRIVLFSTATSTNLSALAQVIFAPQLENKVVAYMPANGHETKEVYTWFWRGVAESHGAHFVFVDNMSADASEKEKVKGANILLITGGNTFQLLHNLRTSGLDRTVKEFARKDEFVLAGFSAGAMVLTPTIAAAAQPSGGDPTDLVDENSVGLTDPTGLGLVPFEVFPHYLEAKDSETLALYRRSARNEVREITDEGMIVLDD